MDSFEHKPIPCRNCGDLIEFEMNVTSSRAPQDGDVSMCMTCGTVSILAVSPLGVQAMREPTTAEMAVIQLRFGSRLRRAEQLIKDRRP